MQPQYRLKYKKTKMYRLLFIFYFFFLENQFTQCMKNFPDEILEIQQNFEIQKRGFGENTGHGCLSIPIPKCCREIPDFKKKFEESTKYPGLKVYRGKIEFPHKIMEDLFLESIIEITKHVRGLLVQKSVDAIILVGGFSESKLIYKSMKESFPNIQILNPHESGLSVLRGAVYLDFSHSRLQKESADTRMGLVAVRPLILRFIALQGILLTGKVTS